MLRAQHVFAVGLPRKRAADFQTRQKFAKDIVFPGASGSPRHAYVEGDGEYVFVHGASIGEALSDRECGSLLRAAPQLSGVVIIVGGEGFYHCYMRSFGVAKAHSACPRCDALGAEPVVANLCNTIAAAIRKVNPQGELIAWPYSAEHCGRRTRIKPR